MSKILKYSMICIVCVALLSIGVFFYISYNSPVEIGRSQACYVGYSDINELIDYADMIIIAKPLKSFEDCTPTIVNNPNGRVADEYTVSPFEVRKVIKGDIKLKSIDIAQTAVVTRDPFGKKILSITGDYYTVMKKDAKYLLFIKKVENENFYSVISLEYGKYNLDGQDYDEKNITETSSEFKKMKDMVTIKFKETFDKF